MIEYSFEDGWTDDPAQPDRRQIPNYFDLVVKEPGERLWYGDRLATGTPECQHKTCGQQIPAHECADGATPLILDRETVFKFQAVTMAIGAELRTLTMRPSGAQDRWKLTVPINAHYQGDHPYDRDPPLEKDDFIVVLLVDGAERDRLQFPELRDREWQYLSAEVTLPAEVRLRIQTSYATSRDLFTDYWTFEPLDAPPPDDETLEDAVKRITTDAQCTSINPDALLQKAILNKNLHGGAWVPVCSEQWFDHDGKSYAAQKAEHTGTSAKAYFYTEVTYIDGVPNFSTPIELSDDNDQQFKIVVWPTTDVY